MISKYRSLISKTFQNPLPFPSATQHPISAPTRALTSPRFSLTMGKLSLVNEEYLICLS
jgi:hypothetical protein